MPASRGSFAGAATTATAASAPRGGGVGAEEETIPRTATLADDGGPPRPRFLRAIADAVDRNRHRHPAIYIQSLKNSFVTRPFEVEHGQLSPLPALRCAALLAAEWSVLGVQDPSKRAVSVILGSLFVGLAEDGVGGLAKRVRGTLLTLIACCLLGALPPPLLRCAGSPAANIAAAFAVALLSGMSPLLGSPALALATKLGAALFAIYNNPVPPSSPPCLAAAPGDHVADALLLVRHTAVGGILAAFLAALPEIVGDRDAARADLSRKWRGLGATLSEGGGDFGTPRHYRGSPGGSETKTSALTSVARGPGDGGAVDDVCADAAAWFREEEKAVEEVHAGCSCLANMHRLRRAGQRSRSHSRERRDRESVIGVEESEVDDFLRAVGRACRCIAFAVQFPRVARLLRAAILERAAARLGVVHPDEVLDSIKLATRGVLRNRELTFHRERMQMLLHIEGVEEGAVIDIKDDVDDGPSASTATTTDDRGRCSDGDVSAREGEERPLLSDNPDIERYDGAGRQVVGGGDVIVSSKCLATLVRFVESRVARAVERATDPPNGWPLNSDLRTVLRRLAASFGRPTFVDPRTGAGRDAFRGITGHALRFALAFSIATVPNAMARQNMNGYWFPMTVVFIMGPTHAATNRKVAHRTLGTLVGIGIGCALAPLFGWAGGAGAVGEATLILLLGMLTFPVVYYFRACYTLFTVSITAWVYTIVVGPGGRTLGFVTVFRVSWTLAAAALVVAVMYVFAPRSPSGGGSSTSMGEKIAAVAEAAKDYARSVAETLRQNGGGGGEGGGDDVRGRWEKSRSLLNIAARRFVRSRITALERFDDALFTPGESWMVPDGALLLKVASDLIDAATVARSVSLIAGMDHVDTVQELLSDMDHDAFNETDRLAARFRRTENSILMKAAPNCPDKIYGRARGPFSNAVARAHHRLDCADIPPN